jgi:hypothetical protein
MDIILYNLSITSISFYTAFSNFSKVVVVEPAQTMDHRDISRSIYSALALTVGGAAPSYLSVWAGLNWIRKPFISGHGLNTAMNRLIL